MVRCRVLMAAAFAFCLSAEAAAQEGSIYGVVTDSSQGALPGVTVTIRNTRTGLTQSTVTDERGGYQARALPSGAYTVGAELSGFKPVEQQGVVVEIGTQVQVNLTLAPGAISETVIVSGAAPLVDTRRSEVGANISQEQIVSLPVQGRQWIDLATLLPGTGQDAIRARYYNSVNIGAGINFYSNGFYIDGVNNNWQQQGEPRQDIPQDAVAEFRVHASNATAQYGFAQGGILSSVTKSGTNEFHGSAFEFYRAKALNAATVFQTQKPDYHRHQLGGSIGGPIVQDRAHFFASTEYTNEAEFFTVNSNGAFPDQDGTYKRPKWVEMVVGRYDQTLTDAHRFFVRVAQENNQQDFLTAGGTRAASAGYSFAAPRWSLVGGETWAINSKTLNTFRVQYADARYLGWPSIPGLKWDAVGQFPQERIDSIPEIVIRPSLTTGTSSAFIGPERRLEFKDDFSRTFGRHELTIGGDFNWVRWNPDNVGISRQWSFSTDRPYDPADPTTYPFQFTQRLAPTYDIVDSTEHSLYIDDRWAVRPNLSLSLGLRYDWQTGVFNEDLLERDVPEVAALGRVIRPAGKLDPALFPFYDASQRGDRNNVGPRVGLSWDPAGDGRQAVRAGYGIYYNRYRANGPTRAELNPRSLTVIINNPSYPDPYQGRDPFALAASAPSFSIMGNDSSNPYTHQYSVGYSRQVGAHLGVSIDGTFAEGYDQHTQIDANYYATPEARAAKVRPNTSLGQITDGLTDGRLSYQAVEVRVERRFADGWQFLGSYTWARAKNDTETFPADQFNRDLDYNYADADRRHRLVLSGSVQTIAGIQAAAIVRYQSSLPVNITAGRDLNGDSITNDRPAGVLRNAGCRALDLDAVNAYRTANGQTAVGDFQCASYLTFDLRFSKSISLGGARRLEGVVQIFNLFNRANYALAVGNALSASFGRAVEVASPRQAELALRFTF